MSLLQILGGILILGSTFISEIYEGKIRQKDLILEASTTQEEGE